MSGRGEGAFSTGVWCRPRRVWKSAVNIAGQGSAELFPDTDAVDKADLKVNLHIHSSSSHQVDICRLTRLGAEQLPRPPSTAGVIDEHLRDDGPLYRTELVDGLCEQQLFLRRILRSDGCAVHLACLRAVAMVEAGDSKLDTGAERVVTLSPYECCGRNQICVHAPKVMWRCIDEQRYSGGDGSRSTVTTSNCHTSIHYSSDSA